MIEKLMKIPQFHLHIIMRAHFICIIVTLFIQKFNCRESYFEIYQKSKSPLRLNELFNTRFTQSKNLKIFIVTHCVHTVNKKYFRKYLFLFHHTKNTKCHAPIFCYIQTHF